MPILTANLLLSSYLSLIYFYKYWSYSFVYCNYDWVAESVDWFAICCSRYFLIDYSYLRLVDCMDWERFFSYYLSYVIFDSDCNILLFLSSICYLYCLWMLSILMLFPYSPSSYYYNYLTLIYSLCLAY